MSNNNQIKIGDSDGISKLIYTNAAGVKYYYVDPSLLDQGTQLYFSSIMAQVGLGIDSAVLLEKLKAIENKVMSMTQSTFESTKIDIIKLTTNIESRVSQLIPTDLLLSAVSIVVFREGDLFKLDLYAANDRKKAILEDSAAISFFTHFALITLIGYKESSKNSVQDYLNLMSLQQIIK